MVCWARVILFIDVWWLFERRNCSSIGGAVWDGMVASGREKWALERSDVKGGVVVNGRGR